MGIYSIHVNGAEVHPLGLTRQRFFLVGKHLGLKTTLMALTESLHLEVIVIKFTFGQYNKIHMHKDPKIQSRTPCIKLGSFPDAS